MNIDVLVLNTAVTDLRRPEFVFADELVGRGGLAKCKTEDMPKFSQEQIEEWIKEGSATAGGCGNNAPLMARAGLKVAVGVNLGVGVYETSDGLHRLDAQGRFFYDQMLANGIDLSQIVEHTLHTGTTFIHKTESQSERGGITYFPNANNDFNFAYARAVVEKLGPSIVYYMYSGLSDRGDANHGEDLAEFMKWCRKKGTLTIVDSHTLTADPHAAIAEGRKIKEYRLLKPLLPEIDIFFTSVDESKLMANVLTGLKPTANPDYDLKYTCELVSQLSWIMTPNRKIDRTRLLGITASDGAHYITVGPNLRGGSKVPSRYMQGEVKDLVGAGDAFRAGVIAYVAKNLQPFRDGTLQFEEAIDMGNLFAALFIKAPLNNRYSYVRPYHTMIEVVRSGAEYNTFENLRAALNSK